MDGRTADGLRRIDKLRVKINTPGREGGTLVQVAISAWLRSCTNEMSRTLESSCYMCPMNSGVKNFINEEVFINLYIN